MEDGGRGSVRDRHLQDRHPRRSAGASPDISRRSMLEIVDRVEVRARKRRALLEPALGALAVMVLRKVAFLLAFRAFPGYLLALDPGLEETVRVIVAEHVRSRHLHCNGLFH